MEPTILACSWAIIELPRDQFRKMNQPTDNLHQLKNRPIRSFVRREGRITPAQQSALDNLWPKYGVEFSSRLIRLNELYNRDAPTSIDIGFGNGISTMHIACLQPDWNHLGIEVHRSGVGQLLNQLEANFVTNVKVITADAVDVLEQMIGDRVIDRFLIFFPDPWPKKRHHKRRLIQPDFVKLLAQKLKPRGIVHLATDWQPYAQWMQEVFENDDDFSNSAGRFNYSTQPGYRPTTKFETRGKNLGHGVFDLIYSRR